MKMKITSTDKLLIAATLVSLITAMLHASLPSVICITVHIAVTVTLSMIHISRFRKEVSIVTADA